MNGSGRAKHVVNMSTAHSLRANYFIRHNHNNNNTQHHPNQGKSQEFSPSSSNGTEKVQVWCWWYGIVRAALFAAIPSVQAPRWAEITRRQGARRGQQGDSQLLACLFFNSGMLEASQCQCTLATLTAAFRKAKLAGRQSLNCQIDGFLAANEDFQTQVILEARANDRQVHEPQVTRQESYEVVTVKDRSVYILMPWLTTEQLYISKGDTRFQRPLRGWMYGLYDGHWTGTEMSPRQIKAWR